MTPAISLLMTTYNRARFVGPAIKSVLAQARGDFELIVWDDGSTDDTPAVARAVADGDPRVRFHDDAHVGHPGSRIAAARLATGPYLGWVDSDDGLHPDALAETAGVLDARPGVGLVYTNYLTMDEAGRVLGPGQRCKVPYSRDQLLVDFMTFHFRLMRRDLFERVGGIDPTMGAADDYDLCLRLSEVTEVHHVPKPLYLYRVHAATVGHEQRLDQIRCSERAIRNALKRRGLDGRYDLHVELRAQYRLVKKNSQPPGAATTTPVK
jgi:glycosyltransferase involved in cell wall biosynthesis